MPAAETAPAWARELALAYESRAHGQFILYGNVHDRLATGGRLVNLATYVEEQLLSAFAVVFSYDLGNGLTVERGQELFGAWGGAGELAQRRRDPLLAIELVSRYLRYLGNLRALERGGTDSVAVILRGVDHLLPANGAGYEHGSLTALVREWASEAPFSEQPFASLLIADNLNDVEPLIAANARTARIQVPLPDAATLAAAPPVDGRVLVGLHDESGVTLGLGLVRGAAADGRSLSLSTPVPRARIAGLSGGSGSLVLPVPHEVLS
jgi:hypothetical protein